MATATIRIAKRHLKSINLTEKERAENREGIRPQTNEGSVNVDKGRRYRRVRHTAREKIELARHGFIPVQSSNVSAVARDEKHLYIRFHNGSIYKYYNQGDKMDNLLKSTSKGKWVWRNLRRKKVRYEKVGSLPLNKDQDIDDAKLFEGLDKRSVEGNLFNGITKYFKKKTTPQAPKEVAKAIKESTKIKLSKKGKELLYKGNAITQRIFAIILIRAEVLRRKTKTRTEKKELKRIDKLIKQY